MKKIITLISLCFILSACSLFGTNDNYVLPEKNEEIMELAHTSEDPDFLAFLSKHENRGVRANAAKNPNTPEESLFYILNNEKDEAVLNYLAANKGAPAEILEELAKSDNELIRHAVAKNPSTPVDVMKTLATDSSLLVQKMLTENENLSEEVMLKIANEGMSEAVLSLLKRDDLTSSVIELLKTSPDEDISAKANAYQVQ